MLRYFMRVDDPDALSDKEWAEKLKELEYIRELENKSENNNSPIHY